MPLVASTKPTEKPVDRDELKDHLNLTGVSRFDTYLDLLIEAIQKPTEDGLGITLTTTTWSWSMPGFKRKTELPRPPLQSVEEVEYRDADGNWQTVDASNYEVNTEAKPGFVRFANDYVEPETYENEEYPWKFSYKAGYSEDVSGEPTSTYEQIPGELRIWMMNLIGTQFMKREADVISKDSVDVVALEKQMARLVTGHSYNVRFG